MSRCVLVIAVIAAGSCRGPGAPTSPGPGPGQGGAGRAAGPGDPAVPGLRLPVGFTPTRYRARLAVDPADAGFAGAIEIEGELAAATPVIWLHARDLDFDRAVATVAGREVPLEPVLHDDMVGLGAARPLPAGPIVVAIDYRGSLGSHEAGGDRYVFTPREPGGARSVFPFVDEPWSKAPWHLTLEVPSGVTAIGNAPVAREEPADAGTRVVFAETRPLPGHRVGFAVGPFELVDAGTTRGGAPIRIAMPRGRAAEAAWAAEVTGKLVAVLEDWSGTPYPHDKLDAIAIPAGPGAALIAHDDLAGADQDARRAYVWLAARQLAHHWLGDLVTPAWWDDHWLAEGFARWMEEKAMALFSPAWGQRIPVVVERDRALRADGVATARALRHPVERAGDRAAVFDPIAHDKGAALIRMLEAWIGADAFQEGVRAYLSAHAGGVATSADFLAAIDAATELDVTVAMTGFLDQAGAPRVGAELRCERQGKKKGPAIVTFTQEPAPRWTIPVCVVHGTAKTRQRTCTVLDGPRAELTLPGPCPTWLLPNADGKGYYRMTLSREAIDDLLGSGWKQLAPHERILLAGDVRAAVSRGELEVGAELELVSRLVRDGSRHATELAVAIARDALGVASDAARPALVAWVVKTFGARARKLGFLPDKGDGLDQARIRAALLPLVTEVGREDKLLARAVELAKDWRTLPASARGTVLGAAVQTSAAVRADLRAAALAPADAAEARDVFAALGAITDPDEAKVALAVLLDPAVDLAHGRLLVAGLAGDPRTRPVAETFLRDHLVDLAPRLPDGGADDLAALVTASCDAGCMARRADLDAWLEAR